MTRTVFYTASTLNGFLADDQDSLEWLFAVDDTHGPDIASFMAQMGVFVEGSATYEWVLRAENFLAEPRKWQQFYGNKPTYVFSSRQLPVPEGADVRFVNGPVAAALAEIYAAAGGLGVWVVGGGDLAGQFLDIGALDEIVVSVAPAVLASGKPLLPRTVGAETLALRAASAQGAFAVLEFDVVKHDAVTRRAAAGVAAALGPDAAAGVAQ